MTAQSAHHDPAAVPAPTHPARRCACAPVWPAAILAPGRQRRARRRASCPTARCSAAAPAGPTGPVLEIVRPTALFDRLAHHPKIGIGEAYMAGDWQAGQGTDLAEPAHAVRRAHDDRWCPPALLRLRGLVDRRIPTHQRQHPARLAQQHRGALRPVSNDLFAAFLDETMTYSSALFDEDQPAGARRPSRRPSCARSTRILDLAGVGQGTRVLEIGTGWGTLAIGAARRGAHGHHASPCPAEQAALARERVADAGVRRRASTSGSRTTARSTGSYDADRQRRDDRGRRRGVLADLLRAPSTELLAPGGIAARPGDPHGARAAAWPPAALLRLDPEVHLPRRPHPVACRRSSETTDARTPRCG